MAALGFHHLRGESDPGATYLTVNTINGLHEPVEGGVTYIGSLEQRGGDRHVGSNVRQPYASALERDTGYVDTVEY